VAAWLHDTGYEKGSNNHEQNSARTVIRLLREWNAPQQTIRSVTGAIEATSMPQNPKNPLEQVLCDADLYHLSDRDLLNQLEGLRLEFASFKNLKFDTQDDWIRFNIEFLNGHTYFTSYGQTVLQERKRENINKLKKMLKGPN